MSECLAECEELLDKFSKLAGPLRYTGVRGERGEEGQVQTDNGAAQYEFEDEDDVKRRPSYTPQLIRAKSAKCFDKRLKTLQELCDETFYEASMELLKETERSFRGDLCYLHTRRLDKVLRKKQRVTNFLFEEEVCDDNDEDEVTTIRPFCPVNHSVETYPLLKPPPIVIGPEPLEEPLDRSGV